MSAAETPWIVTECTGAISSVLDSMTGVRAPVIATAGPFPGDGLSGPAFTWRRCEFSAAAGANIWLGAPAGATAAIGMTILSAAGIDDPDPATTANTYDEAAGQVFASLAQALSQRLRREVTRISEAIEPPEAPYDSFLLDLYPGEPQALRLFLAVSAALTGPLTPAPQANTAPQRSASSPAPPAAGAAESARPNRLDLLLDVELPVSVSFGQSELLLKDVIKLTTGSIIELDRTVSEPVEVIVNNCVIARGEVVVVEGNFGVRIQQVISRQERLRSIQ